MEEFLVGVVQFTSVLEHGNLLAQNTPNNAIASTHAAAILEQMGYIAQSDFLRDFQGFFRDAGALLYAFAAIGGVISVMMYGSFRAARYLILGPAIFWFLVGPTIESEGVKWKIGGGEYLGLLRQQGEASSDEFKAKTLEKLNALNDGESPGGKLDVAIAFYLFSKPISDIVNNFVDIILHKENNSDLAFASKVRGLEYISHALPYEADHIHYIEEFMTQCTGTMSRAISLAQYQSQLRGKAALGAKGVQVSTSNIDPKVVAMRRSLTNKSNSEQMAIQHSTMDDAVKWLKLNRAQIKGPAGARIDLIDEKVKMGQTNFSCAEAWVIISTITWFNAQSQVAKVMADASGRQPFQDAQDQVCKDLSKKTKDGDSSTECDIKPAMAMYTLFNHFKNEGTFNRVFSRHKNSEQYLNPRKSTIITGAITDSMVPFKIKDEKGYSRPLYSYLHNSKGEEVLVQAYVDKSAVGENSNGSPNMDVIKDKQAKLTWGAVTSLEEVRGLDHAMWVGTTQYEAARLRQGIVTQAFQLPYYQGGVLFLLASIYPFFALIVLLPGRAYHFLNLPLAWAWAKSWDVGFAVVMATDRVLYNLLPNWQLEENLREGPWSDISQLADVLTQGGSFDPWVSLHNYYTVLSMLILSIPAITGAITLKARKGILSSFTDGVRQQVSARSQTAAASYSVSAQDRRNQITRNLKGKAYVLPLNGVGGIGGTSGSKAASLHATMAVASQVIDSISLGEMMKNPIDATTKLGQNALRTLANYTEQQSMMSIQYIKNNASLTSTFEPRIGRFGYYQLISEAYAAAMDGGGSFEVNSSESSFMEDALNLNINQSDNILLARTRTQAKILGKVVGAGNIFGKKGSNDPSGFAALAAGLAFSQLEDSVLKEKLISQIKSDKFDVENQIGLHDLAKASDLENKSNAEFLALVVSETKHLYDSPQGQRRLVEFKEKIDAGELGAFTRLSKDIHTALTTGDSPFYGGTHHISLLLRANAPTETVGDVSSFSNQDFDSPIAALDEVGALSIQEKLKRQAGQSAHKTLGVKGRLGDAFVVYLNGFEVNKEQGKFLGSAVEYGGAKAVHEDKMLALRGNIISYMGGDSEVMRIWNQTFSSTGNSKKLNFNDQGLAFSDGSQFSNGHLVKLLSEFNKQGRSNDRRVGGTSSFFNANSGVDHNFPVFTKNGETVEISQVMASAPETVMRVAESWAEKYWEYNK